MNGDEYRFIELFNKIDSELVEEAGGEWKGDSRFYQIRSVVKAACAVLCIGLLAIFTFHPQAHAAIKNLAHKIASIWNVEEELTPYTEIIDKAQTQGGFTFTLNEVILSDDRVYAAVSIDTEYKDCFVDGVYAVTINGTEYPCKEVADQSGNSDKDMEAFAREHLFTFVFENEAAVPEHVTDMQLHFKAFQSTDDIFEDEKGIPFDFAFSVTNQELENNKIEVSLNQVISLNGQGTMTLTKFTLTSVDSVIEADIQITGDESYYPETLDGVDSQGNQLYYWCASYDHESKATFVSELQLHGLPARDSEWVELQAYAYQEVSEEEWKPENEGEEELYAEEDGKPTNRVNLGERFRIEWSQL